MGNKAGPIRWPDGRITVGTAALERKYTPGLYTHIHMGGQHPIMASLSNNNKTWWILNILVNLEAEEQI